MNSVAMMKYRMVPNRIVAKPIGMKRSQGSLLTLRSSFNASSATGIQINVLRVDAPSIMGFSKDCNPLVGPLPERPGEYIAAGFTGHGMPMTFFAGQNVADMIAGKQPEPFVAEAFLPSRFELTG